MFLVAFIFHFVIILSTFYSFHTIHFIIIFSLKRSYIVISNINVTVSKNVVFYLVKCNKVKTTCLTFSLSVTSTYEKHDVITRSCDLDMRHNVLLRHLNINFTSI